MNKIRLRQDDLVVRAVAFARNAHESINQLRKYTKEPYIVHPLAVMDILLEHSSQEVTPAMLAAAACHDLVEDANITLDDVKQSLGSEVADLVFWLTDVSNLSDGPRRVRKALDLAHTAAAPPEAKSIKCADLIDNAPSITDHDPGFARVWLKEKAALLEVLHDADPGLLARAYLVYRECQAKLG